MPTLSKPSAGMSPAAGSWTKFGTVALVSFRPAGLIVTNGDLKSRRPVRLVIENHAIEAPSGAVVYPKAATSTRSCGGVVMFNAHTTKTSRTRPTATTNRLKAWRALMMFRLDSAEGRRANDDRLERRRSIGVPSSRWFGAFGSVFMPAQSTTPRMTRMHTDKTSRSNSLSVQIREIRGPKRVVCSFYAHDCQTVKRTHGSTERRAEPSRGARPKRSTWNKNMTALLVIGSTGWLALFVSDVPGFIDGEKLFFLKSNDNLLDVYLGNAARELEHR
jgi:hypothetical protein